MAFSEINPDGSFILDDLPKISEEYRKTFNNNPMIKTIKLLHELDKTKHSKDFIKHLASLNVEKGSEILAAELAIKISRYDYAIQISKQASYEKRFYNKLNYPIIKTPSVVNNKNMPKQ